MKKYIIDTAKEFTGYAVASFSGDRTDYSNKDVKTLLSDNPSYKIVTDSEMSELIDKHRESLCEPFKEITEDRYYDLLGGVPPKRFKGGSFFMGECYQYDLYMFCFEKEGRYFSALRPIRKPDSELSKEIIEFELPPLPKRKFEFTIERKVAMYEQEDISVLASTYEEAVDILQSVIKDNDDCVGLDVDNEGIEHVEYNLNYDSQEDYPLEQNYGKATVVVFAKDDEEKVIYKNGN